MELFDVVSKVGFPIAIAVYLLVRMEKKNDDLAQKIQKNTDLIAGKDGILDKIEEIYRVVCELSRKKR